MCATANLDPLTELQRENEVIERLLERLGEIALTLEAGNDVAPGEISEGLGLLDRYLGLHSSRLDNDLQPEARVVAMASCFEHLDRILRDHAVAKRRSENALRALAEYERSVPGSRKRLAESLEKLASEDHDAIVYEGDYPLSCLVSALPEDAALRVGEKFAATELEITDTERHLQSFLGAPVGEAGSAIRVHCAHQGCDAPADARVVPGQGGKLGLQVPPGGWGVGSGSPRLDHDGVTRVRVDFFCPAHAGERGGGERLSGRDARDGREGPAGWAPDPPARSAEP